jgi:agmatinase
MFYTLLLPATIAVIATAREISFPSLSGFSSDQALMGVISPDISQAKFEGLATYANLPYVHCLAPKGEEIEKFDIAILGAPFDTVSNICVHGYW